MIDDTEPSRRLLKQAGEIAEALGTTLYLYRTLTPTDFEGTIETLDAIGEVENTSYTERDALQRVHSSLQEVVREVFVEPAFEYETIGAVVDADERAEKILAAAREYDCEHVFLAGRKRSPAGKVLFGDTVQDVLLNFDGEVTVTLQ